MSINIVLVIIYSFMMFFILLIFWMNLIIFVGYKLLKVMYKSLFRLFV